jgi:cell division transport system ATP-binding protein
LDPNGTIIVHLQDVAMRYGNGAEVLRDIVLRLTQGSFHFLMGPSGAGKTSLLRVLSLAQPVCRGRVHVFGRDATQLDRADTGSLQRRIGIVFQDFRLLDHLSAFENVALPLRLAGADDAQITRHVAELVGWLGLGKASEKISSGAVHGPAPARGRWARRHRAGPACCLRTSRPAASTQGMHAG